MPLLPAITRGPESSQILLEVVSEKTGYPVEMLELDMQLDADLGIDSIKRVEILSAMQDRMPGRRRWARSSSARSAPSARSPSSSTARRRTLPCPPGSNGHVAAEPLGNGRSPRRRTPSAAGTLLEVVSEKTGYPVEMLELDMQLDADLGIDSIKRVEILSAMQDRLPGRRRWARSSSARSAPSARSPSSSTARRRTLPCPARVEWPRRGRAARQRTSPPAVPAAGPPVADVLLEVVSEKTGYPVEMLELDMQLDADLGIDSIKRVEILSAMQDRLPGAPAVGPEQLGTLRTLRQIAEFLDADRPAGLRAERSRRRPPEPWSRIPLMLMHQPVPAST